MPTGQAWLYLSNLALIERAPEILSRDAAANGRRIHWTQED